MGFLDKLRGRSEQLKDKAGQYAGEHGDTIGRGLDKASEAANKATGGRFESQVGKASDKAKEGVDRLADQQGPADGGPNDDDPGNRSAPGA